MKIIKTSYYSYRIKSLPKGCQQCVKGEKLVLFITGLCRKRCFFCPVSDLKLGNDLIYANERPIKTARQAVEEARLCSSKGMGITGGDPLTKLNRTIKYIKEFKKEFGEEFHVHLYTPLELVNVETLEKLYKAGLDEIRFHPTLTNSRLWKRIELAKRYGWDVGVEIPCIPWQRKQTEELIEYLKDKVDFLNINELEVSGNSIWKRTIQKQSIKCKDKLSYAVKGSEQLAKKLLKQCAKHKIRTHYCTSKLKDRIQFSKRVKKRAQNIAKEYDIITKDGLLMRGVIEGKAMTKLKKKLQKQFNIPDELIELDKKNKKFRILIGAWILQKIVKDINERSLKYGIIKEYPTYDKLLVEYYPLKKWK